MTRRSWSVALRVAAAGGILFMIFRRVQLGAVVSQLTEARLAPFLAALGLSAGIVVLASWRLRQVLGSYGSRLSISSIARLKLATRFYGSALPGTLPVAGIHILLLTRVHGKLGEIAASVTFCRLQHWVTMTVLGTLLCLLERTRSDTVAGALVLLTLLSAALIAGLVTVRHPLSWLGDLARRLMPGRAARLPQPAGLIPRLRAADHTVLVALAIAENLMAIASLALLARSLDLGLALVTLGWVHPLIVFATALPLTPFGLGVREGGMIVLLEPLGTGEEAAVALGLLMLARNLVLSLLGGFVEIRTLFRRNADPLAEGMSDSAEAPEECGLS